MNTHVAVAVALDFISICIYACMWKSKTKHYNQAWLKIQFAIIKIFLSVQIYQHDECINMNKTLHDSYAFLRYSIIFMSIWFKLFHGD